MKFPFLSALLGLTSGICITQATAADGGYHVINKVALGGDGSWDLLTIDGQARRFYITRSDRVMVVDMDKQSLIGNVGGTDMAGVHGVAVVPSLNRGFITCGKDNSVRVFDLKTLVAKETVKVGTKPDAIIYDPKSKKLFCFNNGGTTVSVIDPVTAKVKTEIELGGAPEFAVSDEEGQVYVNLEDKSEVVAIDTKKMAVKAHWPLAPGTEPTGLAIDRKHRRLFSGCHNKLMVILDADTGKVVATAPIGGRVDATAFDDVSQNAFSSNGDGTVTVIHEASPDSFSVLQTVATQEGSKTLALDPNTHQLWLAAAQFKPSDQPAAAHKRKQVIPESFSILTIGQ